jgi:hypothetical protein
MAQPNLQIPPKDAEVIGEKLKERGISTDCPMCGAAQSKLANGYLHPSLSRTLEDLQQPVGETQIFPCVALVCQNCGFTSLHSLGTLGLMELFVKGGGHG